MTTFPDIDFTPERTTALIRYCRQYHKRRQPSLAACQGGLVQVRGRVDRDTVSELVRVHSCVVRRIFNIFIPTLKYANSKILVEQKASIWPP